VQFATELVGRVGELKLDYAKVEGKTIIADSYVTTPWKFLPPIYLDDTGVAYTLLVNLSGGMVAGDGLSVAMNLDRGVHVLASAPSANRVYRSEEKLSEQAINISVGPDAILEWLPDHTIPFAGSQFRQTIHVGLASRATIVLWDALASGRIARNERWAFTYLENEIRIETEAGQSLVERYVLAPASDLDRIGLVEEWDYVASFYVVNDAVSPEIWAGLESACAAILGNLPGQVLGGVSMPPVPGLAIKLLARTAPDLAQMRDLLWAATREALWNLPAVSMRKY
jgi:urease accessory protein